MTHATGAAGKGARMHGGGSHLRWLPGLQTLLTYERGWLRHDLVAGLALSAFLVPVGMGYAEASGLPAIYGLYATIVPLARLWAPRVRRGSSSSARIPHSHRSSPQPSSPLSAR